MSIPSARAIQPILRGEVPLLHFAEKSRWLAENLVC